MSQRQQFLIDNHLAKFPVTPSHHGTHEMRHEVLSSVDAQDKDTTGHQVSYADLDDVEINWENDQLDVDAVFRTCIDTQFSPTAFVDLEMGGSAENPILLDEEEDKENSPPPTTTPVSETPTQPPALLRSCQFGARTEMLFMFRKCLIMFIEICFNRYYRVSVSM